MGNMLGKPFCANVLKPTLFMTVMIEARAWQMAAKNVTKNSA